MDKSLKLLFELDLLGLIGFVAALFQTAWAVVWKNRVILGSRSTVDHELEITHPAEGA